MFYCRKQGVPKLGGNWNKKLNLEIYLKEIRNCWIVCTWLTVWAISWVLEVRIGWSYSPREAKRIFYYSKVVQYPKSNRISPEKGQNNLLRIFIGKKPIPFGKLICIFLVSIKIKYIFIGIDIRRGGYCIIRLV